MATFPALEPLTRSYRQGRYAVTQQAMFAADAVRFLHSPRPFGYQLNLTYVYLTAAEAQLIRDHWRTQAGTFEPFTLSPEVMRGHGSYALVPELKRWRYLSPPEEEHLTGSLVNMTVALETVEGVWVLGAGLSLTVAIVAGAASAQAAPLEQIITVAITAGAASADATALAATITTAITAGDPGPPGADLTITATLEAGAATGD